MAGMEMSCGRASSVTEACPRCKVVRMARRVGSLRAEKVVSRLVEYLTIRLCIIRWLGWVSSEGAKYFWWIDSVGLLVMLVHWFRTGSRNPGQSSGLLH